jgi:hypothetical protein
VGDEKGVPPARCACCRSRLKRPYLIPESLIQLRGRSECSRPAGPRRRRPRRGHAIRAVQKNPAAEEKAIASAFRDVSVANYKIGLNSGVF